jgi:sugar phosphate isomerase/epimerase
VSGSRLGPDDLIAAHYTLARADRAGTARIPFPERVAAAAAAGFAGIGVQPPDYRRSRDGGLTDPAMHAVLDQYGVVVGEIDGAPWWPAPGTSEAEHRDALEEAVRLGAEFGAHHLVAPMPALADLPPVDELAGRLAELCDLAARHGLLVGLEFLPWTPVRTAGRAWAVVAAAGRANAGITFDFWHHSVGGEDLASLRAIPGERVVAVHFTDGVRDRDLDPLSETMVGRRLPGEGEFAVADLVRALDHMGVRVPITVELVSLPHRRLPVGELAALVHDSVRHAIDQARATP